MRIDRGLMTLIIVSLLTLSSRSEAGFLAERVEAGIPLDVPRLLGVEGLAPFGQLSESAATASLGSHPSPIDTAVLARHDRLMVMLFSGIIGEVAGLIAFYVFKPELQGSLDPMLMSGLYGLGIAEGVTGVILMIAAGRGQWAFGFLLLNSVVTFLSQAAVAALAAGPLGIAVLAFGLPLIASMVLCESFIQAGIAQDRERFSRSALTWRF
jgi:hypothetical protein